MLHACFLWKMDNFMHKSTQIRMTRLHYVYKPFLAENTTHVQVYQLLFLWYIDNLFAYFREGIKLRLGNWQSDHDGSARPALQHRKVVKSEKFTARGSES